MAELNARIIPKASGTAGEVPLATDLETAELAVNTADGTLFTKDTAGAVVTISGGGGGGAVDSVNGQTGVVDLDIQDLLTTNPTPGGLLQYNGVSGEWENVAFLEVPPTPFLDYTALSVQPMIGPATDYADVAAMVTDGWTEISNFAGVDDASPQFDAPASWRTATTGTQFLMQTDAYNGTGKFFANTNGGVGWDNANVTTSGRTGNATDDAINIDCYVSHKSADMKGKLGGWRETVDGDGVRYFVVRLSYFFPYNSTTEYFSTETTFSSDGNITVKYGTPTNTNIIANNATNDLSQGLVSKGNWFLLNGLFRLPGFPGLTSSGDYVAYTFVAATEKIVKIRIQDLSDTPIPAPTDGVGLSYNATSSEWEYPAYAVTGLNDFELNQSAGTLVLSDKVSGVPTTSTEWSSYVISGGTQLYYSSLQTELTDALSTGTEISLQVPGMASPVTVTLTSNPIIATAQSKYIDVTPAVPDAIQNAANGTALTITASALPGSDIPLAEGDVLQWDDTDSKFKPASAVSSVNGETGVIDLEIQDMDDFQLVGPSGVTIYRYDNFTGTSSGTMSADGDWSVFQASALTLYFRKVDSDGNQPANDALFPSSTGGQGDLVDLYASNDQITWFRVNNSAVFDDPTYWSMNTDATSQAALVQSGTLYLSFQDPTITPLAEGDTLRWNDTDSKFKPAEMFTVKVASYSDPVGGQSLDSQTATVITGITNVVIENPIYSNSAGVVTVSEAGVYELYGCVGATGDTANYRWTTEFDVRVDGTMVARQVGGYIRASNDSNFSDIAITTIVELTAGQEIDFTLKRVSNITGNAVTLAHTSRILIKKLS